MSKPTDAWMPLYTGDYLRDTRHLTAEQHGCYLLWLMHYWNNGPLRNDLGALARIGCLHPPDSENIVRSLLADFFFLADDGLWHQRRVDHERERSLLKCAKRTQAGLSGAAAKWGDAAERGKVNRSERMAKARQLARHSADEWEALLVVCGRACVKCGDIGEIVKDHILPVYMDGSDGIENIQPMCRQCNAAKGPENIDYRPEGWRNALVKCLANAQQTPAPSQSQSQSQSQSDTQSPKPTENQKRNTLLEVEKQEFCPAPSSFELVGEGKKKSKKKSVKKDTGAEKDERFNRFHERFEAYFLYVSENRVKAPWDGREGAALKKWLAANPEITEKQWNTILHNRARSGFEQKVRLSSWIDLALSWLDGIADKWGNKPNGGNHAAISDGAGEKILGTVNGSLSGRQYQDYFRQDGDLQTSRKVGQGDIRTLHPGSSRP